MKNKDIYIIILINIILLILLYTIKSNRYIIILIEIILYLSYYIYLLIKKKYIGYKIIISNFIITALWKISLEKIKVIFSGLGTICQVDGNHIVAVLVGFNIIHFIFFPFL